MQWGYINGKHISTVEFPLKHTTSVYSVVATRRYGQNYIHVNDITLTEFTGDFAYGDDYKHAMWLSVGVQQWGEFHAGTSLVTVTFPIAFTVACLSGATWQSNKSENTNFRNQTITSFQGYCHGGTPTHQGYYAIGYCNGVIIILHPPLQYTFRQHFLLHVILLFWVVIDNALVIKELHQ